MNRKETISKFIDNVWNTGNTNELPTYLDVNFIDHSLPIGLPKGLEGTKAWIQATSKSFIHETTIEDMVAEGDKVFIRITMKLKHVGEWRGHAATGNEIMTTGYRLFEFSDNKIVAQWGAVDGNLIEQAIVGTAHACKV